MERMEIGNGLDISNLGVGISTPVNGVHGKESVETGDRVRLIRDLFS